MRPMARLRLNRRRRPEGANWSLTRSGSMRNDQALQPALRRWAIAGAALGALTTLLMQAPAAWLAAAIASASGGRVLLAEADGTIWSGTAITVLTAGAGSHEARALPGRLVWNLRPGLTALTLQLQQACCLNGRPEIVLRPGLGRLRAEVRSGGDWLGLWPAAWLSGLGTPWNTLQPSGGLRLSTRDLALEWVQGRFTMQGEAHLDLVDFASRLSTLPRLGSYRFSLNGDPANAGTLQVQLQTIDGALRLSGQGSWGTSGLRLRGEATAAPDDLPVLNNLLNIIGRRDGARSVISIG